MCGISVLLVVFIIFIDFDYFIFILFEIYTIIFFVLVSVIGSSYERGNAVIFIIFFGFVLRFRAVINNTLMFMGVILLMLRLSKLPMYGLHIWLPKVHVEASIIRSIVLAGAVLKLRILYCWNFRSIMMVGVIVIISVTVILTVIDRKSFAAYSSVLHITLCVIIGLFVMLMIGYIHIILSPLMFITIYKGYNNSRSRFYIKLRLLMIIL
jgi:NADH-ubiquinone oxidoreductase chain 4